MDYRIKIIDLKDCKDTDAVFDRFAEALHFSSDGDKSSDALKKHISDLDNRLYSNVVIYNYGTAQHLGNNYFTTFSRHLFDFNKANPDNVRIDTDYISATVITGKQSIGTLFFDRPSQFGLRGDIGLWEDLENYFQKQDLPENENLLPELIANGITTMTGNSVFDKKSFFIEKYDHGGMSGGIISGEFWTRKAIPLIMTRMIKIKQIRKS